MTTQTTAALCVAVLLTGCPPTHPGGDDAGPTDGGPGNDAAVASCRQEVVLDQPFEIDPEGLGTQIHADAVFDGQGVWVVYNQPNDEGLFDVYLTRIGCDGSPRMDPLRINDLSTGNNVDPGIILVDGGFVVVWNTDNSSGHRLPLAARHSRSDDRLAGNMDVYYRTFDRNGTPIMEYARILETTYVGNRVAGNVMEPTAAPLPGGAFAIAAIRGLDTVSSFQVFVQRLAASGDLDGAALDVVIENDVTQSYPSLAATAAGDLYLAYSTEPLSGDVSLVHSHLPAGSSTWGPLPPALVASSANGTAGSYAAAGDGRVLLAYDVDNDIFVRDGSVFTTTGRALSFGTGGGTDYAARLVLAPGGGAVFWYRNQSGIRNAFRMAGFVDDGTTLTAGSERMVTASPVPPYAPAAAHVDGTIYFAAWSEGTSPNFVLKGVFIDLAP